MISQPETAPAKNWGKHEGVCEACLQDAMLNARNFCIACQRKKYKLDYRAIRKAKDAARRSQGVKRTNPNCDAQLAAEMAEHKKRNTKHRTCLNCNKLFSSSHIGNRLCSNCCTRR